jgi:uncharacterized protein YycO
MTLQEKLDALNEKPKAVTLAGDLILSYENTFASWVIRKATKSRWSHVGICDGKGGFYSAVPFSGVCLRSLDIVKNSAMCRVTDLTDDKRAILMGLCNDNLGKPYDFVQVFLLGWRILTGTIDTHEGDPAPGKYECSEFVAEMFFKVGVQFGKIVDNALPETIWASPFVQHL